MDLGTILNYIIALEPLVAPVELTADSILASIKAAGGMTDAAADADMIALITDALAAKADRDRAAAGLDPQ